MTPTPPGRDRRQLLLSPGAQFNGIDFVDVAVSQTELFVHFLNDVSVQGTLTGSPPVTITGGEVVSTVAVGPIDDSAGSADWSADSEGRPILRLTVAAPGDFSTYTLTVGSAKLDPFFAAARFTFKANCATTLDCATAPPSCPEPESERVTIDYLAKDFGSFKQALSEFSAQRYPNWVERSEADVGMMLMEALAAMADEFSYYQDRVLTESTIMTATQRLSVIRHARLVDYEPAPATTAMTVLQLDVRAPVAPATSQTINTPLRCVAVGADGSVVDFEIEDPSVGIAGPQAFVLDVRWNRANLAPYYWDDSTRCLLTGATDFYLNGQDIGLYPGQQLLLDSPAADSADPPVRELVQVASVTELTDPVLSVELTRVYLTAPTRYDHDLFTVAVAGNIVPAVQGQRRTDTFVIPDPSKPPPGPVVIPDPSKPSPGPVVVRNGANWTPDKPVPDFRYCLASAPLAWLARPVQEDDTPVPTSPEILLSAVPPTGGGTESWTFKRWLLDAGPAESAFTLTPEQYSPVLSSSDPASERTTWYDYDGDDGTTIRFGDGSFGASPVPGTTFTAIYRVGGGSAGNVPADTIRSVAPGQDQGSIVASCTNPFAATGGTDAETIAQVRTRAPQMFRARPLRAVQARDYVAAAQSLPWVRQAGTTFRWTGSWLTVLTSADPEGAETPAIGQLTSLTELLDQRRLAGYESYVLPPRYVSVDLLITVCGLPSWFGSDVETAVLAGLTSFFDHSRWSFGQPLESSALLAAIQDCPGVVGIYAVCYRERGVQLDWATLPETVTFSPDQILRVDNDPSRPEAGSFQVIVEGSK